MIRSGYTDLTGSHALPLWDRPGFLWGRAPFSCSFSAQLSGPRLMPHARHQSTLCNPEPPCVSKQGAYAAQKEPLFPGHLTNLVPGGCFSVRYHICWVSAKDDRPGWTFPFLCSCSLTQFKVTIRWVSPPVSSCPAIGPEQKPLSHFLENCTVGRKAKLGKRARERELSRHLTGCLRVCNLIQIPIILALHLT